MIGVDGGVLVASAAALACVHTAVGIDHSLPFVVLGRSRGWSLRRTLSITSLCGLGHVGSSILIGTIGIAIGASLGRLTWLESLRGEVAAWMIVGFGLLYACWAIVRGRRGQQHAHLHVHEDGVVHHHLHHHRSNHLHVHVGSHRGLTPWLMFVIFLFGPCEALIPLMMAPAIAGEWSLLLAVVSVFSVVTVLTMVVVVAVGYVGLRRGKRATSLPGHFVDALAGLAVSASGLAVLFLGL